MAYTSDDPIIAKDQKMQVLMLLCHLLLQIGSGLGIQNPYNIAFIRDAVNVPVLVDAGLGCASDASYAMELGADGILANTAIAQAQILCKWQKLLSMQQLQEE